MVSALRGVDVSTVGLRPRFSPLASRRDGLTSGTSKSAGKRQRETDFVASPLIVLQPPPWLLSNSKNSRWNYSKSRPPGPDSGRSKNEIPSKGSRKNVEAATIGGCASSQAHVGEAQQSKWSAFGPKGDDVAQLK